MKKIKNIFKKKNTKEIKKEETNKVKKKKIKKEIKVKNIEKIKYKKKKVDLRANKVEEFEKVNTTIQVEEINKSKIENKSKEEPRIRRKKHNFKTKKVQEDLNLFGIDIQDVKIGDKVKVKIIKEEIDSYIVGIVGNYNEAILKKEELIDKVSVGQEIDAVIYYYYDHMYHVSQSRIEYFNSLNSLEEKIATKEVVSAKVLSYKNYNFHVLIDQRVNAMVYIKNIDLSFVNNPNAYVGKTFDFLVIKKSDDKKFKFELSRVDLLLKEQSDIIENLAVGDKIEVNNLNVNKGGLDFSYKGLRGFIPMSEISYHYINDTNDIKDLIDLDGNQEVEIIEIKKQKSRLEVVCSIKKTKPSLFSQFIEVHKPLETIEGQIFDVRKYGFIIEFEFHQRALLHVNEMSQEMSATIKEYKKNDLINVIIKDIDIENEKISLTTIAESE